MVNFMCYYNLKKKLSGRGRQKRNMRRKREKKANERGYPGLLTFHWWKSFWSSWLAMLKYL